MNVLFKCLIASLFIGVGPLLNAQVVEEPVVECDSALVERYDRLIQQSKNRSREERIGWLNSASTACPSYEYFMELGRLWGQSSDNSELASAGELFSKARHIANDAADVARNDSKIEEAKKQAENIANSLFEHADLLIRLDSPWDAQLLINELKIISPNYGKLNAIEKAISSSLSHDEVSRTVADNFLWPPIPVPAPDLIELRHRREVNENLLKPPTFSGLVELFKTSLASGATDEGYTYTTKLYEISESNNNGFIIVTQNERIDHNGVPVAGQQRFRVDVPHRTGILRYLRRRMGPVIPDYVRVMAFIVYNGDYQNLIGPEMENATTPLIAIKNLSDSLACFPITSRHVIDVLVYEYEFGENHTGIDDLKLTHADVGADEHLKKAFIFDALNNPYVETEICTPQG